MTNQRRTASQIAAAKEEYAEVARSGVALYEAFGYQTEEATELTFPDQSRFGCVKMRKSLAKAQTGVAA